MKFNSEKIFNKGSVIVFKWNYYEDKLEYISENVKEILGYDISDLSNKIVNTLFVNELIHKDDLNQVINESKQNIDLKTEYFSLSPFRVHKKTNEICWLKITINVEYEDKENITYSGYCIDITDFKETETALQKSKIKYEKATRLYRLLSDNIPDLVWAKDLEGKYIFANKAICEKLLIAENIKEAPGKTDMFFAERQKRLHPGNKDWHTFGELCVNSDQIVIKNKKVQRFEEFGNVQGEFLYLDVYKAPIIDKEGNLIGTVGHGRIVTEEKEIKQKLIESEAKYRAISEYSTDIIFLISKTGKILYINKPVKETYGVNASEIIDKNFRKFVPKSEIPKYLTKLTKVFLGKEVRNFRTFAYETNGNIIPIEVNGRLIVHEGKKVGLGVVRNVSEQVNFENELKIFSSAVEFSVNGIIITDSNGKIKYLNRKYSEITGFSSKELLGKIFSIFKNGGLYKDMSNSLKKHGEWRNEFHTKKKNGERYWEQISVAPIFGKKKEIISYIFVIRDVTGRINSEKELIFAKEKAEESDRLKSAFLANMSHEIRTPLNAILGFAEFIENKDLDIEKQKKFAGIIFESGNHLLELINNIVDLAKLEAGQVDIIKSSVDIEDLFQDLYMIFQPNIKNNDVDFKFDIKDKHLKKKIISDKTKIKQILINLISNSIKFTKKGFVKYTCTYFADKIVLSVEDTGIGIPQGFKKEVFDRFSQVYKISEVYGGTGLGLSIVKENINLLGGNIRLETELNKGTSFYLEFPYHFSGIRKN